MAKKKLKIFVSSTVYGSTNDLDQIKAILEGYGYEVIMSKEGNIYVSIGNVKDKTQACLDAIKECDLFFGIIFPRYGSGITHTEFLEAKKLGIPMWFIVHERIEFIRKLLEPKMYTKKKVRKQFDIPKTSVLDSIKVVDMYNDVREYWVHPFTTIDDIMDYLKTQFGDVKKRKKEIDDRKKGTK
jgi:hypothetical protein